MRKINATSMIRDDVHAASEKSKQPPSSQMIKGEGRGVKVSLKNRSLIVSG